MPDFRRLFCTLAQLRGLRSQTEVAICLADSDVLAVPSYPESYSIAYLEALSHGLPVMTHAESDSADLVEHRVSGFHMQPYDLISAAQYLEAWRQIGPGWRG